MRRILPVSLVAIASLVVVRPVIAQRSLTMGYDCRAAEANTPQARERADTWVREQLKAFLPPARQALRLRSLQLTALQAELAFKGIMSTCEQYREGRIDGEPADITLSGFEQTISDFAHDLANEAKILAGGGQVSQMGAIRKSLMATAGVGRQAALLGLEKQADEASRVMVETLITFSSSFLNACWTQSFDDEIALQIQRQNELLGTNIDVMPCASRRFKAEAGAYTFESCSFRGAGDWRITLTPALGVLGKGVGSGTLALVDEVTARGTFGVDWNYQNLGSSTKGNMQLARKDSRDAEGNVLNLTYMLSAEFTVSQTAKGGIALESGGRLNQMINQLKAEGGADPNKGSLEVEAKVSGEPCRSLDS